MDDSSIPHGYCSCITLGPTIIALSKTLKGSELDAIASILPLFRPQSKSSTAQEQAHEVGQAIQELVEEVGCNIKLSDYNVPEGDLEGIVEKGCKAVGREGDDGLKKELLAALKAKM